MRMFNYFYTLMILISYASSSTSESNESTGNSTATTSLPDTTTLNQMEIHEELMENTWDYMTEVIFILMLAFLTIPANIALFLFYTQKVRRYKKLKHLNARYARIANSFHTYLIEICMFDTIIVIYLILNTWFQFLHYLKKSQFESVFDISNFACKFFIYILRISGAMSNYLVFLLSLNRCFLILFRYKPMQLSSHRLCLNTKYLTLFLFCICTIANVFRLELLNINSSPHNSSFFHTQLMASKKLNDFDLFLNQTVKFTENSQLDLSQIIPQHLIQSLNECGPNIGSISYSIGDSTNALFWSIIIYNLIFAILPAIGNLVLSVYLIKKRTQLKVKLICLTDFLLNAKLNHKFIKANDLQEMSERSQNQNQQNLDEIVCLDTTQKTLNFIEIPKNRKNFQLNEFHAEFLKTCSPCIAFSLTHVILFLPYSIIELINQIRPSMSYMTLLQYMTYARYLFYCCKFYLLFFVSYRFRREFNQFVKIGNKKGKHKNKKSNIKSRNLGFNLRSYNIEMKPLNNMKKADNDKLRNGSV